MRPVLRDQWSRVVRAEDSARSPRTLNLRFIASQRPFSARTGNRQNEASWSAGEKSFGLVDEVGYYGGWSPPPLLSQRWQIPANGRCFSPSSGRFFFQLQSPYGSDGLSGR